MPYKSCLLISVIMIETERFYQLSFFFRRTAVIQHEYFFTQIYEIELEMPQ